MSNLGTIYSIDTKFSIKNKFPIVYSNKTYYYCKQYGADELIYFYISKCDTVENFYKSYKKNNYFYGNVFVPPGKDFDIPKLSEKTVLENEINYLAKKLEGLKITKNSFTCSIDRLQKDIISKDKEIEETRAKISLLYRKLASM